MSYLGELTRAMTMLAADPRTLFVGQAVRYGGQRAHQTFSDVPMAKRVEMPVVEDMQMGYCTGLALEGFVPVSFFPRWDFLICAASQLVNHLDKLPLMGWQPKVIIRVAVGAARPLNPGPQHTQNHTAAFRQMLKTIEVVELTREQDIVGIYEMALKAANSFIVVEHMELY